MRAFRLHLPHHRLFFGLQLCANDLCKPLANRLLSRRGESACARRSRGGRPRRPGRRRHQHENAGAARHWAGDNAFFIAWRGKTRNVTLLAA